jgi:PIN domain nuclease of toxin-antitoxin system
LQNEKGAEKLTDDLLDIAVASTVNLAEVQGKLVKRGFDPEEAWELALSSIAEVESLTADQSRIAGNLIQRTEKHGLSLGDRCCLALAIALEAEVYTADHSWSGLNLGIPIHVIR